MNPYTLTAAFVGLATYYLLSRKAPARHAWPLYLRVVVAWAVGLFWPLLTIWAVGWCIRHAAVAAFRWVLGEHNKVRVRIDLPPNPSMAGASIEIPAAFFVQTAGGIVRYGPDGKIKLT